MNNIKSFDEFLNENTQSKGFESWAYKTVTSLGVDLPKATIQKVINDINKATDSVFMKMDMFLELIGNKAAMDMGINEKNAVDIILEARYRGLSMKKYEKIYTGIKSEIPTYDWASGEEAIVKHNSWSEPRTMTAKRAGRGVELVSGHITVDLSLGGLGRYDFIIPLSKLPEGVLTPESVSNNEDL